jgi:uncharacterized Tic20 family protein
VPLQPQEECTWAMWAHLGALLVTWLGGTLSGGLLALAGWVFPLVVMNMYGDRSPYVRESARESLNFQLSWLLYWVVLTVPLVLVTLLTFGIGLILFLPVVLAGVVTELVLNVVGAVKASRGEPWRYPMVIRFVR